MKRSFLLSVLIIISSIFILTPNLCLAKITINEIRIDQPSTDNDEYFELIGPPGESLDGLTYLVIGDGAGGSGVIEAVVDLSGQSIPASGFFVAAESTFTLGPRDLTIDLNFENDDNVTHLLVKNFTGADGYDLDTNDDGTLDSTPWAEIVDLVALIKEDPAQNTEYHYGPPAVGPDGSFVPGHIFRCPEGWQIGQFGPVGALDTPGAQNLCVRINEIRIDQLSTDYDEYFELAGTPGLSLDGLTYIVIGDGPGGSGVIEAVVDLSGQSIPASGFFVVAESTFTLGTANLETSLNFENDDNVTHLLVKNFTGTNGYDLDTNDDGTLDSTPWAEIVDLVALIKEENPPTGTEYHYGPPTVGPDGSFVPGHVFRCSGEWKIGLFGPVGALDTPGAENLCVVKLVALDIKPGGCPNPLDVTKKDDLPAAILGSGDFDVNQVDIASLRLEGVPPHKYSFEDVATPFEPYTGKEDCFEDCTTERKDGFVDLTLKFDPQAVLEALGYVSNKDCLVLTLTGNLQDGTPIVGEDVIIIRKE